MSKLHRAVEIYAPNNLENMDCVRFACILTISFGMACCSAGVEMDRGTFFTCKSINKRKHKELLLHLLGS